MGGAFLRSPLSAAAALVAGFAGGWVAGRASLPAPPPPAPYVNPFAEVKKGESLVLKIKDGSRREVFRVLEVDEQSVLLAMETVPLGGAPTVSQIRVARSFLGFLIVLEGDMDPQAAAATMRDFALDSVRPDAIFVESLQREFRCWKVSGTHRVGGAMTFWISDEVPVHGVLRVDTPRGKLWEVDSMAWADR